ncbi:hypothetical protein Mgra_00003517 [Meloidogyne graminicola]|uniref:Uncharacterized protein n=1 Tax=Meloidogyne graminicola TaxID=189291 RepID=A0A8S9ZU76_9BILA|nr:hypothetical protein Mgra_00003517 [Meloidogyne graminicola]
MFLILFLFIYLFIYPLNAHFCGNNKIPYGVEVFHNGQPALLCSKPNCFEKYYADCDDRAIHKSCNSNNTWVGGFDKNYGNSQPPFLGLYLQCCEFELLPLLSKELYSNVLIRPGEYFEGEEVLDKFGEEVLAFDFIKNMRKVSGGGKGEKASSIGYLIDVWRFQCDQMIRPKKYKPWKWP